MRSMTGLRLGGRERTRCVIVAKESSSGLLFACKWQTCIACTTCRSMLLVWRWLCYSARWSWHLIYSLKKKKKKKMSRLSKVLDFGKAVLMRNVGYEANWVTRWTGSRLPSLSYLMSFLPRPQSLFMRLPIAYPQYFDFLHLPALLLANQRLLYVGNAYLQSATDTTPPKLLYIIRCRASQERGNKRQFYQEQLR